MATLKILVFPPPEGANWFGNGTLQRRAVSERVILQKRATGNQIRRNKPRTIPFPCSPAASPGPFCPYNPPWNHTMSALSYIWRNSLTPETKASWNDDSDYIEHDRMRQHAKRNHGWRSFVSSAFYSRWYVTSIDYLLNPPANYVSQYLDFTWVTVYDQNIHFRIYWQDGHQPQRGNVVHCFQVDPKRIHSMVPWRFTRAIGQFENWQVGKYDYNFSFPAAWPFEVGDDVWAFSRETAGTTSWNQNCRFHTAQP